ncbi:MAG: outer membrane receptor for ferrienterochelin and colicins, partial [Thalassolituus oleivorans]
MRFYLPLTLAAALLLGSMSPAPTAAQSPKHVVAGTVLDGETGQPLPNANVLLRLPGEEGGALVVGAATDLDGLFSLRAVAGTYRLDVRFVGFEPHSAPLVLPRPAGDENPLRISLTPAEISVNQITITASRRPERRLQSPSSVTVLDAKQLNSRSALTIADHLQDAPAVDVIRTGLNSSRVVVRGFNDNLSSNLLTLVDNRIASAPAVRLTAMQLIPTNSSDMERIEVLSGPASALYGPNAANGVVHVVTKSPFDDPGTSFTVSGGQQSLKAGSVRHAAALSRKWAYKVT